MSILNTVKEMGYFVRIDPMNGKLAVSPWSTCPPETRQWFTDNKPEIIRALKPARKKPAGIKRKAADNKQKVGTTLKTLIEKKIPKKMLASVPKETCGCQNYEKKMNAWGVDGCVARENEIVNHLVKQADSMGAVARAVPVKIKQRAAKKLLGVAIKIEKRRS